MSNASSSESGPCTVQTTEDKGRGLFASRNITAHTVVELSPVLMFSSEEYEAHGRHTILDHYTFKWPDGRMALALGLGSLFNHSDSPNISFSIDTASSTIRFIAARQIKEGEELCIFYGHRLWFTPAGSSDKKLLVQDNLGVEAPDEWDPLWTVMMNERNPFSEGNPASFIAETDLPFIRTKVVADDEDEDMEGSVRTIKAWVVDVPDPKKTSLLLKWVKDSGLETADLLHLKRIRRAGPVSSLLLTASAEAPPIPQSLDLPEPYQNDVPESVALTPKSLKLKLQIWPTVYAPRRKGEPEPWTRAKAAWAWEAVEFLKTEARTAAENGELPIVSYLPRPFVEEINRPYDGDMPSFLAYDTRRSTANPLRHSVFNVTRKVADWRASHQLLAATQFPMKDDPAAGSTNPESSSMTPLSDSVPSSDAGADVSRSNGTHYLLTGLTLFTTNEPCIMCSMALLHSRVREIIFVRPMDTTGGCGGSDGRGTCVPRLKGVNHRYTILRWMVEKENKGNDCAILMGLPDEVDA